MLKVNNLSKNYGEKKALTSINFELGSGEIVGIFGENGAGKTTLIKSILNLIAYKGEVLLDGRKIDKSNITQLSFATSEHSFFPSVDATTHKNFYQAQFSTFNENRFNALMRFFELPYNKNIEQFSMGQKNQFEVILAFSQGARYIFMDEPFAGNDVFNREDFYKMLLGILKPDETLILSTHLIDEVASVIDRVLLISKGELIADTTIDALEGDGQSLKDFVKQSFNYNKNRVLEVVEALEEESDA